MGYLQGEGQNLSGFSQFVEKAEVILRKLRVSNIRVGEGRTQQEKSKGMYSMYKLMIVNVLYLDFTNFCAEKVFACADLYSHIFHRNSKCSNCLRRWNG